MARIQVLSLPADSGRPLEHGTPFVFVIDQLGDAFPAFVRLQDALEAAAMRSGARTVLICDGTLDVA